ncbi:LiaF transmembrane domain-containing protein [Pedobacter gandavensis]|uniref:LiaF transmembrane domain-containing protein n=1 Tax=Pedobacter gandavensis TaxID=2679963 RepID=A0ABR6F424_9SPHI|nr:DUF5668 domain-containing protein [Pedobacter gandavensis]MBB2151769.1 hypothetical protein [Pedobacter gandavensis]
MKTDRIMWGIVLLFIGGVLLLENFHIIDFYWRNVIRFWPIFLIIAGVNILFSKNKSQVGGLVSIGVLVITLSMLFVKGQQRPDDRRDWFGDSVNIDMDNDNDNDNDGADSSRSGYDELNFSEPFNAALNKRVVFNISGGGTSFQIKGETDSLLQAHVEKKAGEFSLTKSTTDSSTAVTFKMKGKSNWSMNDGGNDVDFHLNKNPEWELHMNMGAGEVDFDLSDYKVRTFNFDGGAAALDIKLGDRLPITDVNVKTGIADVKIKIPTASGCRIKTKTGLSAKDFTGFTKMNDGTYETPNYSTSTNKIFINFDGGLSSFEVTRY